MARTYAVADLHGRFDLLEMALAAIKAREPCGKYKIVFLGDYIDRGPQSRQIIERLIKGPDDGATWICLTGNHEAMMLACLAGVEPMKWWLGNGGKQTLMSYGSAVPQDHQDWLAALPLFYADGHRVFVHGWVDPEKELTEQDPHELIWHRYARPEPGGYRGQHVVHGHVPYEDGPLRHDGRTDLDTLAWKTGRLVVGAFDDDMPGRPVDLIELRA